MIDLEIIKDFEGKIEPSLIMNAARVTLAHHGVEPTSSLSILITTDQQIQELNRNFRGFDQPTDVLAFPASHSNPEDGTIYLGDIIISLPRAAAQANQRGHPPAEEIQLLVIHGILHLLDFDHADPAGKQQMWSTKRHILDQLGISSQILEER
jgi:probable rRNA maturation factor